MRTLHRQFFDHCEYAVRQAVGAIAASSITEIAIVQSNLSAPFLVGVLSLLVSKPTFGETMSDIYSLVTALYGLLLAWPIAYGIGPHTEWAHGLALFVLVFLFDLLDERPLRPKLAQLLALIVFATFAGAADSETRDSLALTPLRLAGTVGLSLITPAIVACIWPRLAGDQILLRIRAAAHLAAIAFTLSSRSLFEDRDSPAASADSLRSRSLRRLSQELVAQAQTMIGAAGVERSLCIGVSRANELAQLQRSQSNLLAMERTLMVRFRPRFRAHVAQHLKGAVATALLAVRHQLRPDLGDSDNDFVISEEAMRGLDRHRLFDRPHSFDQDRDSLMRALYELRRDLYRNRGAVDATSANHDPVHFSAGELSAVNFWLFHALSYLRHLELMISGSSETIGLTLTNVVDGDDFHSAESSSESHIDTSAEMAKIAKIAAIDAPPEASVAAPRTPWRVRMRGRLLFALRNAAAVVVAALMVLIPDVRVVWQGFGVWCAVSTLLVVERDTGQSLARSIRRLQGTALGSAFGAILVQITQRNVYGLMFGLFLWILVLGFVRSSLPASASYSAYVAGFTPLLIVGTAIAGTQDTNLVAILRIQLTFLGVFIGIVACSLPMPTWLGKQLLTAMCKSMELAASVANDIVQTLTTPDHETHVDDFRRLVSSLDPLHTLLQAEPVLWNVSIPPNLATGLIKRFTCIQRRLVWCNSAARRLPSSSASVTVQLFVVPLQEPCANAIAACTVYLKAMAQMLTPVRRTLAERRELDHQASSALLAMQRSANELEAQYNEVSHSIVDLGAIKMQTRDVMAFTAFFFAFCDFLEELGELYQDATQLVAAYTLRSDGTVVLGTPIDKSAGSGAPRRRSKRFGDASTRHSTARSARVVKRDRDDDTSSLQSE